MLTSDQARQLEGGPAPHAHTWGRRGSTGTQEARLDDLGDRPAPRPGSQDHPGLPQRRTCPGRASEHGAGPTRAVPHLPLAAVRRRPARVGLGPPRRGQGPRLRAQLPELRAPGARCGAAAALRGVPRGEGPRHDRDRPPRRRGDPVGLVRAPGRALGGDRLRAARHAAALRARPRRARRADGPGPPRRGDGRGHAAPRRHREGLADRPPGDGDRAGDEGRPALVRARRQALRRGRRALPAEAREPQGRGRVLGPLRVGPVVADHGRDHDARRPGEPRPLLGDDGRRAPSPRPRRTEHGRSPRGARAAACAARRSLSRDDRGRPRRRRRRHRRLQGEPLLSAARALGHRARRPAPRLVADDRRGRGQRGRPRHPPPRA